MNGINKQLALLDGIPVVIRSALAFENSAQAGEIILAVPAGEEERYAALCSQYGITKLKAAVHGGATRFLSVKNALEYVSAGYAYIAIHDGARPLISTSDIDRVLTDAVQYGSAIAAAPVTDTIKQVSGGAITSTPDRSTLYAAQTPQAFRRELYASCMEKLGSRAEELTDDSALLELCGEPVHITPVTACNMKVTRPDDQAHIRRLYEYTLEKNGYQPYTAGDGAQALKLMETTHIDLVILDLMMPTMDGYTFLKTMRDSGSSIPVLIITARDSAEDVRKAFTMGTDDFMVKPVDDVEMILRIRALLRRARISEEQKITVGSTTLIYDSFTLIQNGTEVQMPKKEFQILFKLLSFPNKTFTRANLMEEFWDMDSESEARTVDVHINRLRDRLKDNKDIQIVTVRGLGYKAVKTADKPQGAS